MLNRRESSKIKFQPPRLIRKHSRYKFNLLLERDEVVIGGFGFSVERYEKLTANRDDWRRIARAPVNRVTSTKDGKVGGGWEDEEEKKRRGGSGFKVVVVVAGWWEWHGGKESRAVAAKSAHSAALLDRLWNINLQHYRPEERTFPPSSPLLLGLYATSSTPETSSNNLEPLGMDFEFLDTPSTPHSPSDSPTTRLPIYSSRWKNHRCDAFYSTLSMERTRSSRFRFQRILTRRIFIPISVSVRIRVTVCTYVRDCFSISRIRARADTFPDQAQRLLSSGWRKIETRRYEEYTMRIQNNKRMTPRFLLPFRPKEAEIKGIFQISWKSFQDQRSIRSIDQFDDLLDNKTNRLFFSFDTYTPISNSFEGLNDNRRRGVFARDTRTHFSLQLPLPR